MFTPSLSRFLPAFSTLVLSLGVALPAAHGQNVSKSILAHVPFDFESGSSHLIAGDYKVQTNSSDNFVVLRGPKDGVTMLSRFDEGKTAEPSGKLIFHRYRGRCFLREIRFAGTPVYLKFPESSAEKQERIAANAAPATLQQVATIQIPH